MSFTGIFLTGLEVTNLLYLITWAVCLTFMKWKVSQHFNWTSS
jgi:hypothetical protein